MSARTSKRSFRLQKNGVAGSNSQRSNSQRSKLAISAILVLTLAFSSALAGCAQTAPKEVTLATTTSVNDSGLMDYLKPVFEKDTEITLKVVAQGTGQAVKTGENGDADVLFIHDKTSEEKFVADGFGLKRIEIAYNYFVIVGPKDDPAGIKSMTGKTASEALKQVAAKGAEFVSRGDDSGTNKKEIKLWKAAEMEPEGDWYVSAGKGMGAVLTMAGEMKAYTLTDKATYLSMKDKLELDIVLEDSGDLMNQYTIIAVNPEKHEGINKKSAEAFVKWITSDKALKMIDEFGRHKFGESLFRVNYSK